MKKTKKMLCGIIILSFIIMPVAGGLLTEKEEQGFQVMQHTDKLIYRRGETVQIFFR